MEGFIYPWSALGQGQFLSFLSETAGLVSCGGRGVAGPKASFPDGDGEGCQGWVEGGLWGWMDP